MKDDYNDDSYLARCIQTATINVASLISVAISTVFLRLAFRSDETPARGGTLDRSSELITLAPLRL